MKYPHYIAEMYQRLTELEDQGFEEQATTNDVTELVQIEREMIELESLLDEACYEFEMESNGYINENRVDNLYDQLNNK